jgi:hypothetical protein
LTGKQSEDPLRASLIARLEESGLKSSAQSLNWFSIVVLALAAITYVICNHWIVSFDREYWTIDNRFTTGAELVLWVSLSVAIYGLGAKMRFMPPISIPNATYKVLLSLSLLMIPIFFVELHVEAKSLGSAKPSAKVQWYLGKVTSRCRRRSFKDCGDFYQRVKLYDSTGVMLEAQRYGPRTRYICVKGQMFRNSSGYQWLKPLELTYIDNETAFFRGPTQKGWKQLMMCTKRPLESTAGVF